MKGFAIKFFCAVFLFSSAAHSLSLNRLKEQLRGVPAMNVGFDVDDTLLFSSPAFYYAVDKYCTMLTKGNGKSHVRKRKCDDDKFWKSINTVGVPYSMPKAIGYKLIDLHKSRGDNIWFITKRPSSPGEVLTSEIKRVFGLSKINAVVFTNMLDKSPFIKERNIQIYYGDDDDDIKSASNAGARGIRVERAPNSNNPNTDLYNPGIYGEDVLDDSAY